MFLGIDIGTSSVKACLVGPDLDPRGTGAAPLDVQQPAPGHREQDPEAWWAAVLLAARQALGTTRRLNGIGLSGQMHGVVLCDAADRPLRPAILWDDSRGVDAAARLRRLDDGPSLAGAAASSNFAAAKLGWLRAHDAPHMAQVAHIAQPKDWIGHRLHGRWVTDMSEAAGTWLFDQAGRHWSPALCDAAEVRTEWLPTLHEGPEIVGQLLPEAMSQLGLEAPCPIVAGAGDTPAGALAAGVVAPGQGLLSIGTSGQIFVAADHHVPPNAPGLHSFAHALPDRWYRMAALVNGGRPLAWLARLTGAPVPTLLAEAEAATSQTVPLALPYLAGERTPLDDPAIRGAFYGLSDATDRGALARAMIEGIAYGFASAKLCLGADMPDTVLALGGGTRGAFLLQTIADATGLTLRRVADAEIGAALGVARLAAFGTGAATLEDLARPPRIDLEVRPDAAAQTRHATRLTAFHALYDGLACARDLPR